MSAEIFATSALAGLAGGLALMARNRHAGLTLTLLSAGAIAVMQGSLELAQGACPAESAAFGHIRRCPASQPLASETVLVAACVLALICAWAREPAMSALLFLVAAVPALEYARAFGDLPGRRPPQADPVLLEALLEGLWPLLVVAACTGLWAWREARLPRRLPLEITSAVREMPEPELVIRASSSS